MKKTVFILTFNISLLFGFSAVASVDKKQCSVGDIINFKIELEDADSFGVINIEALKKDFTIISGPSQQTSMQWINGNITNSRIMSWSISPNSIGDLIIPAFRVKINNKIASTKKLIVQVKNFKNNKKDLDVFISAELSKNKAYLGEQVTLTYKLYRKVECSVEPFEIPKFPGFWSEELFRPNQIKFRKISLKGVQYQEGVLYKVALFPISGKEIKLKPLTVKIQRQKRKKRRGRDPFFDPFFDSFFTETETKILRSQEHTLSIKEYPGSRPSGFTGGVGDFKISTTTDTDSLIVNEAVTFNVSIEGTGNIGLFSINELKFSDEIDQFPPKENFDKNVFRDELSGKITWEYILVPRIPGSLTIPPINFTFFNPETEEWNVLSSKPKSVNVKKTSSSILAKRGLTKREIEVFGKDIKYIYNVNPNLKKMNSKYFYIVLSIYLFSIVILIIPNLLKLIVGYNIDSLPLRRSKNALRKAIMSIKKTKNEKLAIDSKIIYLYLKEKFHLPNSNLDSASVRSLLVDKIDDHQLYDLIELIKLCDSFSYGQATNKNENIYRKSIELLSEINRLN